jgi:hypothetical protein
MEFNSLLRDLGQSLEAKNLKSSAVGKEGVFPVHKAVQPAKPTDELVSGPKIKVVSVRKDDFRPHFSQLFRGHGFYGGLGTHRDKGRGVKNAMSRAASSQTRQGFAIFF